MCSHQARSRSLDAAVYAIITAISFLYFILIARLTNGNLLNSFPFISQDGFDWLFEGKYIEIALSRRSLSGLPLPYALRQPVFVGISTVDAVLGSRGLFVITSLAISLFLTMLLVFGTLKLLGVSTRIALWGILLFIFNPLGYYRFWILSDQIAIMFMHLSTFLLLLSDEGSKRKRYIQGAAAAVVGGWTQVYALIPYGLATIIFIVVKRAKSGLWDFKLFYLSGLALTIWGILLVLWYKIIPHETNINQFALLGLNLNMANFYINTLSFAFIPYIPLVAYTALEFTRGNRIVLGTNEALIVAVVVCFAILSFFYQWPEARFTFLYAGYVVILACVALQKIPGGSAKGVVGAVSLALTLFVSLLVVPGNYWQPNLREIRFDFERSWLAQAIRARPVDRFGLVNDCYGPDNFCTAADATSAVSQLGAYALRVTSDYRILMLQSR